MLASAPDVVMVTRSPAPSPTSSLLTTLDEGEAAVEQLSAAPQVGFPGEWYDLNTADHFWFRWRVDAALRQFRGCGLPVDAPLRVLDVGGGKGILRDQLEARTAWVVDLVELNQAALRSAAPGRGRHLYYDVLDERADLLGSYDAAVLYDVIEHVEPTAPLLRSVARHLKPGGLLLVNVPALAGLFSAFDVASGHHRRYGRASLVAELPTDEWDVLDVRYWGLALIPLLALRKLLLRAPTDETIRRGFGPPSRLMTRVLTMLGAAETAILPRPPAGTSLLLAARRR
jgi:2-polyprenyl-3-methyl-5-hydroxy-6-metoxy-1,4-benzoquinol methylase